MSNNGHTLLLILTENLQGRWMNTNLLGENGGSENLSDLP